MPETNDGIDNNCDGGKYIRTKSVGVGHDGHYYSDVIFQILGSMELTCQTLGYEGLALVKSSAHNTSVADMMLPELLGVEYWIGLSDGCKGDFVWVDGEPICLPLGKFTTRRYQHKREFTGERVTAATSGDGGSCKTTCFTSSICLFNGDAKMCRRLLRNC